jgi:hypothetical protein
VNRGVVTHASTGEKTVMTAHTPAGVEERPVPEELRRRPVLAEAQAVDLAAWGARVQELFGAPGRLPAAVRTAARADRRHRHSTALTALYEREIGPHFVTSCRMLEAAGRQGGTSLVKTHYALRRLMGERDAEAMLTGVAAGGELASLGLITGLNRLARGEIGRDEFARAYGHRGPHEFELSIPRPGEDSGWVDTQLAGLRDLRTDTTALLARQEKARDEAWARFAACYPARTARMRERVRR